MNFHILIAVLTKLVFTRFLNNYDYKVACFLFILLIKDILVVIVCILKGGLNYNDEISWYKNEPNSFFNW
jgi:hypothetical protein